ncbi:MAG: hypothetical protein JWP37_1516 [Mucilaginibacter sp.]|nr:hypothetical protein [Mucilaginibacter sp.]
MFEAGFNNYCIKIELILLNIQFLMEFSVKIIKFTPVFEL